jgi:hypothetical protein
MASKSELKRWVYEALAARGASTVTEVAKHIWEHHETELRNSGDLFFTWQYDMRWQAQSLQNEGRLSKKGKGGRWELI